MSRTAAGEGRLIASYQTTQFCKKRDLREICNEPEEIKARRKRLAYGAWARPSAIRYRLSRRRRSAPNEVRTPGPPKRTLRGELSPGAASRIDLFTRARRPHRPVKPGAVLLDVSGSMQAYSRFFLQFAKGLISQLATRLKRSSSTPAWIRVSDACARTRPVPRHGASLALMTQGIGGGTKIGAIASAIVQHPVCQVETLNSSRSVVLILSDGYDTGSCDDLVDALSRLRKRAPRLVWLNPLLGWRDYEPINKAMVAAMPLIDHFAAAHSLEALAAIEPDLARL